MQVLLELRKIFKKIKKNEGEKGVHFKCFSLGGFNAEQVAFFMDFDTILRNFFLFTCDADIVMDF